MIEFTIPRLSDRERPELKIKELLEDYWLFKKEENELFIMDMYTAVQYPNTCLASFNLVGSSRPDAVMRRVQQYIKSPSERKFYHLKKYLRKNTVINMKYSSNEVSIRITNRKALLSATRRGFKITKHE